MTVQHTSEFPNRVEPFPETLTKWLGGSAEINKFHWLAIWFAAGRESGSVNHCEGSDVRDS
jgi:hypothetical protein